MTWLTTLWLPILLSALFVFVASSVIHMALPWHKNDYRSVPDEQKVSDALRPFAIPPGDYMMPRPTSRDDFKSPEFVARLQQGPNMLLTVLPNESWKIGATLGQWFVYCLVVSCFAAIVATAGLGGRFEVHAAFHFTAITAFIGYSVALWQEAIWSHRSVKTTFKSTIDGLIYGLITGATFMWLWPR